MYLRWLIISIYAIVTTVLAMVLTPIACLFANHGTGRLPWIFRWMETPDQLLPGDPGIVGTPTSWLGFYKASCKWLWRNPAYRATDPFKFVPLTHKIDNQIFADVYPAKGNVDVNNQPFVAGWFYGSAANTEYEVFDLFVVWKWPCLNKCVRIRLGWKLQPWYHGNAYDPKTVVGMHVFSITPFMSIN